MDLEAAIATQPLWVQYWVNWLFVGAFILPVLLIFWKDTRILGIGFLAATIVGAFAIFKLFDVQGYTRLLGLPHLIVWVPAVFIILRKLRDPVPRLAQIILLMILATIVISLAFDFVDVGRYILGDRGSMIPES